jgi:DNA invertase Pin-like site-specific DNA recombinase
MKVGYARVSSRGQSLEVQIEKLRAAGCEKVFEELAQALEYVREGDALIVTKLDRLARSLSDLSTITGTLSRKEVGFVVLDQAIDTTTPTGRLTFHLLGAIAEFERDLIAERRDEGIALAKNRGVKFGRKPKLSEKEKEDLREAHRAGGTPAALMEKFGISKASFYRAVSFPLS